MYIGIITPAPPRSLHGNRITAVRWAKILRKLGHRVAIRTSVVEEPFELLIALHARRSFDSIRRFCANRPEAPIIVALTGTDLYRDLRRSKNAQHSLDIATRIVVLQRQALDELPPMWRAKARIVYQSVSPLKPVQSPQTGRAFDVCVVGHLRWVKDPFRAAMAARLLPPSSRIRVIHLGGAMSSRDKTRARQEMASNPRYKWLGEVSPSRVLRVMARSRLFVISSRMEGGANSLGEAIVASLPVLASKIPGSTGILGPDYPGYFEVGDSAQLAMLMLRCENDARFLEQLESRCRTLISLFDPMREQSAWVSLLQEVART